MLRGLECLSNTHVSFFDRERASLRVPDSFFHVGNSLWIESTAFICSHCIYSCIYFLIPASVYQLCLR